MTYEIYWGAGSPNCWRVLLGLEVKRLDYQSRLLEFSKQQHRSTEMLAMNPRGQLPVLKDGDNCVYESIAILAYLDKKHPDPPLFGISATDTAQSWQTVFEIENHACHALSRIVRPVFTDTVNDNIDSIKKSVNDVHAEFIILQTRLDNSDYLTGCAIAAADIILFPFVQALLRVMTLDTTHSLELDILQLDKFPAITNWIKRIEQLPGYDNTYPPNWNN